MSLSQLTALVMLSVLAALSVVRAETPGCKPVFTLTREGDRLKAPVDAIEACPAKPGKTQRLRVRALASPWIEVDVAKAEWQRLEGRIKADLKSLESAPAFSAVCPSHQQVSVAHGTRTYLICDGNAGPVSERLARLMIAARQLYFPPKP